MIELYKSTKSIQISHFGQSRVIIGDLLNWLMSRNNLIAPRSGHIGSWSDINSGRSGALDFNKYVTQLGVGRPLIYSFTQTESKNETGDINYRPGTDYDNNGKAKELALLHWNGKCYADIDRARSYFVPFLKVRTIKGDVSLVHYHLSKGLSEIEIISEAELIYQNWAYVEKVLLVWLQESIKRRSKYLNTIFSHFVTPSGEVYRSSFEVHENKILMNETQYGLDDLLGLAIVPFLAASKPELFFSKIEQYNSSVPILSHIAVSVLSAMLGSHSKNYGPAYLSLENKYHEHIHWGARAMAGYPPQKNGYFIQDSNRRALLNLVAPLIDCGFLQGISFKLLPASMLLLMAPETYSRDLDMLDVLFEEIVNKDIGVLETESISKKWFRENSEILSSYFVSRFNENVRLNAYLERPANGQGRESTYFRKLRCNQACAIVSGFYLGSLKDE